MSVRRELLVSIWVSCLLPASSDLRLYCGSWCIVLCRSLRDVKDVLGASILDKMAYLRK
jgi:hypothetical protein